MYDRKFTRILYSSLINTGEVEWPWVFTASLPEAYSAAFMGCQDNIHAANLLHEKGVLLAPVIPGLSSIGRLRPPDKAKLLVFAAKHEEICDGDDDLFAVRFRSRVRAVAFVDRLNAYLERLLNPWIAQANKQGFDLGESEFRRALRQAEEHSHIDAVEDGRLAFWLDELLRRRGAWDDELDFYPQFDKKPSIQELIDQENDLV